MNLNTYRSRRFIIIIVYVKFVRLRNTKLVLNEFFNQGGRALKTDSGFFFISRRI